MLWLLLLAAAGEDFRFDNLQAWKYNEGRQERIPALNATLINNSGRDWKTARFRIAVECEQGGERAYEVTLRDLAPGPQPIDQTAFDAIGEVAYCPGPAGAVFQGGEPVQEADRPAFAIVGFSFGAGEGEPSTELEGILDYRREADDKSYTTPVFWRDRGARVEGLSQPGVAFYAFSVRPGRLGLAGFLLSRDRNAAPLSRFLRFYDIAPNTAAFLGIYRLERTDRGLLSLIVEPAGEVYESWRARQRAFLHRPLARPEMRTPGKSSVFAPEQ